MTEKGEETEHGDAATLWSSVATGLASSLGRTLEPGFESRFESFKAAAARISPAMKATIIRKTRVTWREWLQYPWHAILVKGFCRKFPSEVSSGGPRDEVLGKVFRAAAVLRFGVSVDYPTYRRLRQLVVDHEINERELKHCLGYPTIWWGTAVVASPGDGYVLRILKRLWTMGRPPDGEIVIARFHWITRGFLALFAVTSMLAMAYLSYAAITTLILHGPRPEGALFSLVAGQLAFLVAGLLWFGPCADRAALKIAGMLQQPE